MKFLALAACVAGALALLPAGCGYHVSGHADMLPKNIKTIAVPAFANATTHYRITETLPAAITREFIARTRYNIVADPNQADAVLNGTVVTYAAFPTTFDPATGRATAVQLYVHIQITLRDRATGTVIYSRPDFEARERYEISTTPSVYFDESDPALDRVSQYVARMVVSGILEKF
jgi:outer membrane lipopolysaccharide assembly protein LptE/RlpB